MKSVLKILIISIIVISLAGCKKQELTVNKDTVEQLLRDIYTPESLDDFYKAKEDYVSNNIITSELAEEMFTVADGVTELSEDDLARRLSIHSIVFSDSTNNSVGAGLYKIDFTLKYQGNNTNVEMILSLNSSGKLYKRDTNIK